MPVKPPTINFFKGHPTSTLLPNTRIANAYNDVLLNSDYLSFNEDADNQHPLQYGTDPGNLETRKAISKWEAEKFGIESIDPDCINLTAGASYGVANILTSATDAIETTKRIFIVSPTYYLINQCFIDAGFGDRLTAIDETPGKEFDIDVQNLETKLRLYSKGLPEVNSEINIISDPAGGFTRKVYRFAMYLVPTFSNPGGITYSLKTREKLVKLARDYDMLLISDDVYEFLNYREDALPPRLCHLDRETLPSGFSYGNTVSNATFSKILAPGIRFGWQETPTPALAAQLAITGANKSGGTPGQLASVVVQSLIESGELENTIKDFKQCYLSRADILCKSIKRYLPHSTTIRGGKGGYFLWVTIEANIDHEKVVDELATKHNVILAGGNNFEVCGDERGWGKNSVRLSISYLTENEIERGIQLWGEVLREIYPDLYS